MAAQHNLTVKLSKMYRFKQRVRNFAHDNQWALAIIAFTLLTQFLLLHR